VLAIEDRKQHRDVEYERVHNREEYELEKARRELEAYRLPRRRRSFSSLSGPRERETARKVTHNEDEDVKLSQKETETAVIDFLASFSTLCDDVPPEERNKVLDSVPLVEEGEGEDSDEGDTSESNSHRRSSLVDD
jgi:hypothetical protein